MTKQTVIIHPHIKATLKNLDLDLESELNRYEQYLNSLQPNSQYQLQSGIPNLESQNNLILEKVEENESNHYLAETSSALIYESAIIEDNQEELDTIPVASRIITPQKSLLDILLTPWGIFGLILFFATNILLFVNQDDNRQIADKNSSTVIDEQLTDNNNTTPTSESNNTTNTKNTLAKDLIENRSLNNLSNSQPPSPPSPLPIINNSAINNDNQTNSLYPDLKTALIKESETYQTQLPPPPPNYPVEVEVKTPPPPNNLTNQTNNQTAINQTSATKSSSNQTAKAEKITQTQSKPPQTKHYVVADYKSMEIYAQVKAIMKEAFITNINNEMKIQLGVFNDKSGAEKYNQQMKSQGLETKIMSISP